VAKSISTGVVPLAIPYRFLDSETPWFLLPQENVAWSYNFELTNQGVSQRKAYSIESFPTLGAYKQISWAQPYEDGTTSPPVFFCATNASNQIVYLDSNYNPVFSPGLTALSLDTRANFIMFNNKLISIARPFSASAIYDGATWGTLGYTFTTITDPYIPCAHKGRMYIANNVAPPSLEYYPVGAVAGAPSGFVSFEGVLSTAIQGHASFQSNDITTNEQYYCVWDTAGNVVFYAGDNPGSTNWTQIGFAKIGNANNVIKNSYIRVGGDIYIIARSGLYSARSLLLQGSLDVANLAAPIRAIWTSLFASSGNYSPAGHFSIDENRIYINFPGSIQFGFSYADFALNYAPRDKFSTLIYDRTRQAWMYQQFGSFNTGVLPIGKQPLPGYERLDKEFFGVDAINLLYRSCLYKLDSDATIDTTNSENSFLQTYIIRSRLYFSHNSAQIDGNLNTLKALKANIFLAVNSAPPSGTFDAKAGCVSLDGGGANIYETSSDVKLRRGNQVVTFNLGAHGTILVPYIELIGGSLIRKQSLISAQLIVEKGAAIG